MLMVLPSAKPQRIFLDANAIIVAFEGGNFFHPIANKILEAAQSDAIRFVTTSAIQYEVMAKPVFKQDNLLTKTYHKLFSLPFFEQITINETSIQTAFKLGAPFNFRFADALHFATAFEAGCKAIVSDDKIWARQKTIPWIKLEEFT